MRIPLFDTAVNRPPTAPAFAFCGDATPRDWGSGAPLPQYEGRLVRYSAPGPWLFLTRLENGVRVWDALPREEW